jgi:hypothetical protein
MGVTGLTDAVVDVGRGDPSRYLLVRGFEVRGGRISLRAYMGGNVWIDDLLLPDGAVHLAEWTEMERVHVTRCRVPGAETFFPVFSLARVTDSVIAANHLEGSAAAVALATDAMGNRVAGNMILGSAGFAILAPGSGTGSRNVFEGNILVGGTEQPMLRITRNAHIRNNLVINDSPWASYAFSIDPGNDLTVVHNTFVASFAAVYIGSIDTDIVFANNACYARDDRGFRISSVHDDGGVRGNVVFGKADQGTSWFRVGNGLRDFVDLTWDGASRDAHPVAGGALVGAGVSAYHLDRDLEGYRRGSTVVAGAYRLP